MIPILIRRIMNIYKPSAHHVLYTDTDTGQIFLISDAKRLKS